MRWLPRVVAADAMRILKDVYGSDSPAVPAQLSDIRRSMREGGEQMSAWAVVTSPDLRRPLLLGVCLQLVQQAAGINTVMYYSGVILRSAGFVSGAAIWLVVRVITRAGRGGGGM